MILRPALIANSLFNIMIHNEFLYQWSLTSLVDSLQLPDSG